MLLTELTPFWRYLGLSLVPKIVPPSPTPAGPSALLASAVLMELEASDPGGLNGDRPGDLRIRGEPRVGLAWPRTFS